MQGSGPGLGFQRVPEGKVVKNRVPLEVHPPDGGSMEAEMARLEGLGARQQRLVRDDDEQVIVIDHEGNEFCMARC